MIIVSLWEMNVLCVLWRDVCLSFQPSEQKLDKRIGFLKLDQVAKPEAEKVQMLVNGIFAAFPVTCDLIMINLSFSIIDDLWVFQTWTLVRPEVGEETALFLVLTSANFSYWTALLSQVCAVGAFGNIFNQSYLTSMSRREVQTVQDAYGSCSSSEIKNYHLVTVMHESDCV